MAPAPASASILFHPKNKKKLGAGASAADKGSSSSGSSSPKKPRPPRPRPPPDADADSATTSMPEGHYTEFNLVSSALNGWKYDVMKFDSRKPVDILKWETPVKLNRKELRRPEGSANDSDVQVKAVGPMLGPDGKPVIGMDGRVVMVDAEGKPIHSATNGKDKGKDKGGVAAAGKKKFQPKKTKQVYKIPEATRQLRKEERYPWVMEDATGTETWVGKMEEVVKAETHAFFMPASNNTFKFVPAHRWYKFQKRPNYHIPDLEEAESLMAMRQKNKDPERWLLHNRNGQGPSAATAAIFKAESDVGGPVRASSGQSLGPGGRRLRTVVNGSDTLFGDDDEDDAGRRRRKRDLGADADYDEVPYQEDFADDEEKMEPEQDDDEVAKEMEERLQREYMSANKQRDGHIDESDSEDESQLTGAGKAIKKLMTKLEKNDAYDDDEEGNPYASSEEEEEEEEQVVTNEPAVQAHLTPSQKSRASSQTPSQPVPAPPATAPAAPASASNSRATSPVPNHGGHSVVAKRATSPKAPKPKAHVNGSRAGSPLAQSAATLPTSAGVPGSASRAGSPSAPSPKLALNGGKPNNKRKATDEPDTLPSAPSPTAANGGGPPKAKKRKAAVPALGPDGQPVELQEQMVIDWLRNTPNAKTRDCISYFTPYLRDEEKKAKFTALIREVAQLKNGILVLRNAYRNAGAKAASGSTPIPMDTK
ncbi:hypothetical protein DENSPDRAFT_831187 [Dentipellis sp. KUC8613]|nr:hypothetical protein DENSPDRAFT_831187 [Dentipellis sp. KUC8613]